MKFITSTDLRNWASSKECQNMLPELVKRLINVSAAHCSKCRMPTGDAVYTPGWDGIVETDERIYTIEPGTSLWECGCNEDVKSKINDDFNKRTGDPLGYSPEQSTFVFVTPRLWGRAEDWTLGKKASTKWKNIVVITAVELEDWIYQHPVVGIWLARFINKIATEGIELVDDFWSRWATGNKLTLRTDLLLGGREGVAEKIRNAISEHGLLYVSAITRDEAKAYIVAVLKQIAEEDGAIMDRCIIVSNKNVLQDMASRFDKLIFIYDAADACVSYTSRENTIVCAVSPADNIKSAVCLPKIKKDTFVKSLEKSGLNRDVARRLATDTSRNVNILRRRQEIDFRSPLWLRDVRCNEYKNLLLAGQWKVNKDGDRDILSRLTNMEWARVERISLDLLHKEDSPLMSKEEVWRVASPYEVVSYISQSLSNVDLETLKSVFMEVMSDDDEDVITEMNAVQLALYSHKRRYSDTLRKGLCRTFVMLALQGEEMQEWVDSVVAELYRTYDLKRYLSNRRNFVTLAEASPVSTLRFIQNIVRKRKDFVEVLFKQKENFLGVGVDIYYGELLSVLEELAWNKDFVLAVSDILVQLMDYPTPSNMSNKPIASLRAIFRYQLPQTKADENERSTVLDTIVKAHPKQAFTICKEVLDSLRDRVLFPSCHFSWRDFGENTDDCYYEISAQRVENLTKLLIGSTDWTDKQLEFIVDILTDNAYKCCRNMLLTALKEKEADLKGNETLCNSLRKEIFHHRSYQDSEWAMSKEDVASMEELLNLFLPDYIVGKYKWVFDSDYIDIPHKSKGYHDHVKEDADFKMDVVGKILSSSGIEGIFDMARVVKCPSALGESFGMVVKDNYLAEIKEGLKNEDLPKDFVGAYFCTLYCETGFDSYEVAVSDIHEVSDLVFVLCAPGFRKDIASYVEVLSEGVQKMYWENVRVWGCAPEDARYLVEHLCKVNRFAKCVEIICHLDKHRPFTLKEVVNVLCGAVTHHKEEKISRMNLHYLFRMIKAIDKEEIAEEEVVQKLVDLEIVLYRGLKDRIDIRETRLMRELQHSPELLMELIEFAYPLKDEMDSIDENKRAFGELVFEIVYDCKVLPGFRKNGTIDYSFLKDYILKLRGLGEEKRRQNATASVIGTILGNIPSGDDYPAEPLCELLEELDDDHIDEAFRIRLFNKRGVVFRGPSDGGTEERSCIKQYRQYANKTRLKYERITNVFRGVIQDVAYFAKLEDVDAWVEDLEN